MKALTLWPEWAFAIARYGKDGENRTWRLWSSLIGQPLAIHAGMRPIINPESAESVRSDELWAFKQTLNSIAIPPEIRGTWREIDQIRGRIVAVVTCGEPTQRYSSPWSANDGQWFWPFTSVRVLPEPVPCRGAQGLWDVPAHILPLLEGS